MASVNNELSNATLVDLLLKNSDDIGAAGYDVYYGYGRVNAYRAVIATKNTIAADTIVPVVSINSPANGATLSGSVDVSVSATDNAGVSKVELYLDGVLFAQSGSASATFSWDTRNALDGTHTLEARAYDAANNVGSTSISVTVRNSTVADTTSPSVAITSPQDGSKITTTKTLKVYVSASDNVSVTKVELYIHGKFFGSSTSSSAVFTWNTGKVTKGAHTLQAYAYDAAGNIGVSSLVTVYK